MNKGGEQMRITLVLKESIYDCKIQITDSKGSRYYMLALCDETAISSVTVDVFDDEFDLALIPVMPDTESLLNEWEENNWKDKLAKKASKFLLNTLDKMILRVGCNYHVVGLQDGDRLDISMQYYAFGTFDRFNILELAPICYMFFEASNFNDRFQLTNAYETNRKDVLKYAKTFAFADGLGNGLILSLFTYPIQVGRMKRLTNNKKILKTLTKFNHLSDTERQRFLEKQERFLS